MRPEIKEFMEALKAKTVGEAEFHQAVEEVIETVWDTYQANPKYKANKILEKMVEPERVIMFRVPWFNIAEAAVFRHFPCVIRCALFTFCQCAVRIFYNVT